MKDYTSIYNLKSKGVSIRKISELLNLSRNTVRKYLRDSTIPKYTLQNNGLDLEDKLIDSNKSKWDKYYTQIIDMYFNKKYIGSRIYNELKGLGAMGSETGFYYYLNKLKKVDVSKKARGRFETGPGKQEQFDWSHYSVKINNEVRKVYVFLTILSFSRYKHFIGSFDMTQGSLFESKEAAYKYFGGVPEESLMDNARQMVKNASKKNFAWNDKFLQFMDYYGVNPKACKVRHAWTKGKVENPFYYLEQHFIKGNEFESLTDFNAKLLKFTEIWHNKKHQGINGIPAEIYLTEKEYLAPLPETFFVGTQEVFRKASNDSMISFEGNKYSIPSFYAFKHVWIKKSLGDQILIYSQKGKQIAKHNIPKSKNNTIIIEKHYEALQQTTTENNISCKERFLKHFPGYEEYIEILASTKRLNWKTHINKILNLLDYYDPVIIEKSLQSCKDKNVYNYDYIHAFISQNYDIETIDYQQLELFNNNNVKVNLEQYEELI